MTAKVINVALCIRCRADMQRPWPDDNLCPDCRKLLGKLRTVEVWSGVWTASPGLPRPGDRWDPSDLIEVKYGRAYVSGRGGSLWVAPSHWREVSVGLDKKTVEST